MNAEIITIGDELLIGQVIDTNSAWIARRLNLLGIRVRQISSLPDEEEHILRGLQEAETRAELIIITGGLGPTKDDITKKTLCKYFNTQLRLDEEALENVKNIFSRYNAPLLDINMKQAEVPENCEVIQNKAGTAPGMLFRAGHRIFISLPGVPFEMISMMEERVIPLLKNELHVRPIIHKTLLVGGIGESFLSKKIESIEDHLPAYIKLAYLPNLGLVRLRLSGYPNDEHPDPSAEIEKIADNLKILLSDFFIAEEDISLEKLILKKLEKLNKTISLAESCTGGYISHLLTSIPGSSKTFLGGGVAYSYSLKEQMLDVEEETLSNFGAVSEEVVRAMAAGALHNFQSDYVIACSGIAGPDGGTPEKPVGTVWIAAGSKEKILTKKFQFGKQRMQNIERTAIQSLIMLLKLIEQEELSTSK